MKLFSRFCPFDSTAYSDVLTIDHYQFLLAFCSFFFFPLKNYFVLVIKQVCQADDDLLFISVKLYSVFCVCPLFGRREPDILLCLTIWPCGVLVYKLNMIFSHRYIGSFCVILTVPFEEFNSQALRLMDVIEMLGCFKTSLFV